MYLKRKIGRLISKILLFAYLSNSKVLCETLTAVSAEKVNAIAILNAEKCDVFTLFGIYQ